MIWLGLKLLGLGKWLKEAFAALLGFIRAYPLQAALIASLAWGAWERHGKMAEIARHKADAALCRTNTEEVARKSQEALRLAHIAAQAVTEESRHAHDIRTPIFAAAAADYKRRNSFVQHAPAESGAPAPGDPDPGAPVEAPADAVMVGITGPNFDACSASSQYALEAWEYLDGLRAKGLALPVPEFGEMPH